MLNISEIELYISRLTKNDKTLTCIQIYQILINVHLVKRLSFSLCTNTTLVTLSLCGTNIGNRGVFYLSQSLKANNTIKTLKLIRNVIGDEGCLSLSSFLSINRSIEELDLLENNIGNEGVQKIAESIACNTSLLHLRLWNNKIGNEGVKYLASSISINETLTELILSENTKIDTNGMKILEDTLRSNNISLKEVVITHDYDSNEIQKKIDEICTWNEIGNIELISEMISPMPSSCANRIFFLIWIIKSSSDFYMNNYFPSYKCIYYIMNMLKVQDVVKSGNPIDYSSWI